ncbi:hypothetical protein Holit_00124 [Hollandina sp. SP2]
MIITLRAVLALIMLAGLTLFTGCKDPSQSEELDRYTVTFAADGGTFTGGEATQTRTVDSGGSVGASNMPANPSKNGYSFGGWFTAQNGGGSPFTGSTPVSASITVYAHWTTPGQSTVTFDAAGGSFTGGGTVQTRTVSSGGSVGASNMPSSPSKSGSSFGGWYTAQNGGGSLFTGSTPVSASITVYAHWTAGATTTYTVTFNAEGGSFTEGGTSQTRTVSSGASVGASNMPANPVKAGYTFNGWYTAQSGGGSPFTGSTTVSASITVYAYWTSAAPATFLEAELARLAANAAEGGEYTITLNADEPIPSQTLSYGGKNIHITLSGGTTPRTIALSSAGSLFTIEQGVTLTLDNNLTLQGRTDNTASLVRVNSGGTLVMNDGSKITGNTASSSYSYGGGVYVYQYGTFTMSGGEISGNTASAASSSAGGGVYVYENGTFTMSGGEISGNTASASDSAYPSYGGGGVYAGGMFTMSGGKISGNTASASDYISSSSAGGGVYVYENGTFTMSGGEISGNTASASDSYTSASSSGGGVYVYQYGTFTMSGGEISGNTTSSSDSYYSYSYGGGVYVFRYGTFTMSGGEISGNTASAASSAGGGVYVYENGTFTKQSDGVIYGSDASDTLKNTAGSNGHAVGGYKKRNTTAGSGVTLDSSVSGSAGGWE